MKRIVLDTNVLVSALLSAKGAPAQVWSLVLAAEVELCVDQRILDEYYKVLCRSEFGFPLDMVNSVLAFIDDSSHRVTALPLTSMTVDPDDQSFVEIAIAAKADFLVTGNLKHFKGLPRHHFHVLSPRQFIDNFTRL